MSPALAETDTRHTIAAAMMVILEGMVDFL
jgi:hypothetical protein